MKYYMFLLVIALLCCCNVHNSEHPHPVFPPQLASFEL